MIKKVIKSPLALLGLLIVIVYWQFFFLGKIPLSADTLAGAYYPWLDYKWGYDAGIPVKNPVLSDAFSQFFPWKYLAIDFLKKGQWPLWNIYEFSGTPFLATYHSAPFLPFNLFLLLPKHTGWGFFIFFQTFFAAVGMYLFSGLFTKNSFGKIAGGLVFSLSALMSTWAEFGTGVWAAACLPWIFYSLNKFWEGFKFRFLFLFLFSFVCLFFAGNAQITLYSIILVSFYLVFHFFGKKNISLMTLPVLFLILAVGIFSIQLLPVYDMVGQSIRSDEAFSKTFNFGLNPGYEIIRLVAADFFGNPASYNYWDDQTYHEQSIFLGTITLALISPFVYRRFRNKEVNFWGFVFLISLFLGFSNPFTKWFYSLPLPFLTYSSASRIFFLLSFSAGFLISIGIDLFFQNAFFRQKTRISSALILGLIAFLAGSIFIVTFLNLPVFWSNDNLKISFRNLFFPLIFSGLFFLVSYNFFLKKNVNKFLGIVIILVLFADLSRYFLKHNPFVEEKIVFPQTPVTEFLQNQKGFYRMARADKETFPPNSWVYYKISSAEGYDPLALNDYATLIKRTNGYPEKNTPVRFVEIDNYPSKFLDVLNVKYLTAIKKDKSGNVPGDYLNTKLQKSDYKKIFEDKTTVILENEKAKDRAFFVKSIKTVKTKDEAKNLLFNEGFDPSAESIVQDFNQKSVEYDESAKVLIEDYLPNLISFRTSSKKPGFLVFSESYEKNWKLFLDGQPDRIYQTDVGLRGVFVPAGEHDYRMVYSPDSFVLGQKITFFSLLISLGFYFYARKTRQI